MSYILDALRRADAERGRGAVPGLHSLPVPLGTDEPATPRRAMPWPWIGVGAAVLIAAPLLWRSLATDALQTDAQTPSPAAPAAAGIPPAPAAAPVEAARPPAPEPLPVARQPQSSRSVTAPAPRPDDPPDASPAPAQPPAALPGAPGETRVEPHRERAATARNPAAAAGTRAAPGNGAESVAAIPREQLPEDLKRRLPPLAVGGSMYSPEPSKRMLILNGQLVREGETVGPDLVLESIRLRSAILRIKDQRFEIAY